MTRTYDDGCGIAHALDLVGERWALLVVRELLLGPKRFTDLRAGLPGVPTNVLSTRLRELEQAMLALGRWGARTIGLPGPDRSLRSGWLAVACKAFADREAARGVHATC